MLGRASTDIIASANLVKQVVFPVELLPLQWVLRATVTWLVGMTFLIGYTSVTTGSAPLTVCLFFRKLRPAFGDLL